MSQIKAIETVYKGYRFRSRLEARWAVFFDALGVRWEYEKEGYDFGFIGRYLPDFWLPDHRLWVEIKGNNPTENEHRLAGELARVTEWPVVIFNGQVGFEWWDEVGIWQPTHEGRVHFGSGRLYARHVLPGVYRGEINSSRLQGLELDWRNSWELLDFVLSKGASFHVRGKAEDLMDEIARADSDYYQSKYGKPHYRYKFGWLEPSEYYIEKITVGEFASLKLGMCPGGHVEESILNAFKSARSARFEHGENGAPR